MDTRNPNDLNASTVEVQVDEIPGPDFTTYQDERFEAELQRVIGPRKLNKEPPDKEYSFPLTVSVGTGTEAPINARGLACRAFRGRFWSVTLRSEATNNREVLAEYEDQKTASVKYQNRIESDVVAFSKTSPSAKGKIQDYLGYCPANHPDYMGLALTKKPTDETNKPPSNPRGKEVFLNDIYTLSKLLYDTLLEDELPRASGLIVVTGATDSSKSLITRGLIFLYLEYAITRALAKGLRKPHLVTYEDPIEQYFIKDPSSHSVPPFTLLCSLLDKLYLDYTPREKDSDSDSVAEVLRDALRQTPAVLFVGETRKKDDWGHLLEFAGSGHLVVTTSHASSVVESMSRIFNDTQTHTPAQRSEVARRILGIVNIRSFNPRTQSEQKQGEPNPHPTPPLDSNKTIRALLPAVWKSTPQSKNNLIADGLSSLLPALGDKRIGCYSRTYFASKLIENQSQDFFKLFPNASDLLSQIKRKAREWDIEGV